MENKERMESSSFTADLFGAQTSPPSAGIFASIFPPPSMGMSNYTSSKFKESMQKLPSDGQNCYKKHWTPDNENVDRKGEEEKSNGRSIFEESVVSCPLSSSLYYGSQEDMYVKSSSGYTTDHYPNFTKATEKDDDSDDKASRGNWWQGSLYY